MCTGPHPLRSGSGAAGTRVRYRSHPRWSHTRGWWPVQKSVIRFLGQLARGFEAALAGRVPRLNLLNVIQHGEVKREG